ncbi:MAG: amidohydrolase [Bacteroidales bacterium]|nr:amidohydrolase [Bacteroidales bacterium]
MNILIYNVLLNDSRVDIRIEGNRIASINPPSTNPIDEEETTLIDGTHLVAFPPLVNAHTHSAMTLFRSYGVDLPLERWLNEKIWPNEANLDPEIVYWGSRLACIEMIKSGTACFNDMYFFYEETARAVEEMGMRAMLSFTCFDHFNPTQAEQLKHDFDRYAHFVASRPSSQLVQWAVAPHAVYTVSGPSLRWIADFAREHAMRYHIHAAETQTECRNSLQQHGATPIRWLQQNGVMGSNLIVAHGVWLDDEEIAMLGQAGATVVHNPCSNLKLGSGYAFKYNELRNAGVNVALGTDGCSSSDNLDMIEAMKFMSLLQKGWRLDPTALPAQETLQVGSLNGYRALGIDAGIIAPGHLADLMLLNLDNLSFVPYSQSVCNLVYATHGEAVDTMIVNGKIIMRNRQVAGEEETISQARRVVKRLIKV